MTDLKKTAFLYAGQGSQHAGMGKDLYEQFPEYRELLDNAKVGFDLREVSFADPNGQLSETEYTQPCMVAFACGINRILKKWGMRPAFACGLSLGEYSALNMAGVWEEEATIEIAAYRGKIMSEASRGIDAGMTAVIGLSEDEVSRCCLEASDLGVVSPTNFNCPNQVVVSGEKAAVDKAASLAKERGARNCVPLAVSGPFHTIFMKPAGDLLKEYFETVAFQEPDIEVLYDCLGGPSDGTPIPEILAQQVQKPVRMENIIRHLFSHGAKTFVEIGPGTTLSGFVKKTAKAMGIGKEEYDVIPIESAEDLRRFCGGGLT